MKRLAAGLIALVLCTTDARTDDPYKEGVRDYYSSLCYRARPYLDGPPEKAAAWERGFRHAQRHDHDRVDRSHCRAGVTLPAQSLANSSLPLEFHGLWVTDADRECPDLKRDEDAHGMGEGALLLHGDKFYSHESLCRLSGQIKKSCCDGEGKQTIASNYSCGSYTGRVLLHLRRSRGEVMLIESYENAASGPVVKIYRRKCS
jgi:hypothetical protein